MDSSFALEAPNLQTNQQYSPLNVKHSQDALIISQTLSSDGIDKVDVGINGLSDSLILKARKIIDKLNELLKTKYPGGIQSLKPEEATPEATADRIVQGSTAFFAAYAKQNPNMDDEELLTSFMELVRKGVEQGYSEAYNILEGLGAFEFEGVKEGIEKTKGLIESKLQLFEKMKREELGLPPRLEDDASQISSPTKDELLAESGVSLGVKSGVLPTQTLKIAA